MNIRPSIISLVFFFSILLFSPKLFAQDKNVVKLEALILKAEQEEDKIKKRELYNKAGTMIRDKRMDKDENVKIGDSYLMNDDVTNAAKYYMRCNKETKADG